VIPTAQVVANLGARGLALPPDPPRPGGAYLPVRAIGGFAFVAAQFPVAPAVATAETRTAARTWTGRLGRELTTADGVAAAELAALNVLAQIHHAIGFERVAGLARFEAYLQTAPGWDDFPAVVDGASNLFLAALGPAAGAHARALYGVERLPRDFVLELAATFALDR
jgi:enamine deaminase RidA (YjgF/YER057c/UK114 family)